MKRLLYAALSLSLLATAACTEAGADTSNPVVVMETSKGTIKIELFADKAPITVKNFLNYVDEKFYDGTIFHRVIPDFMIQGGGFTPGLTAAKTEEDVEGVEKKTHDPIKNESHNGLPNERGTSPWPGTNDPDSATAQFFINVEDNTKKLDPSPNRDPNGYCVFGKVIEGMDVVDKIKDVRHHGCPQRRHGRCADQGRHHQVRPPGGEVTGDCSPLSGLGASGLRVRRGVFRDHLRSPPAALPDTGERTRSIRCFHRLHPEDSHMPATQVVMETSLGTIKIELDGDKAPIIDGELPLLRR